MAAYVNKLNHSFSYGQNRSVSVYDSESDHITTYRKIQFNRIIHEPPSACDVCTDDPSYPASLNPLLPGDLIVVTSGGSVPIGNITYSQYNYEDNLDSIRGQFNNGQAPPDTSHLYFL